MYSEEGGKNVRNEVEDRYGDETTIVAVEPGENAIWCKGEKRNEGKAKARGYIDIRN